VKTLSPCPKTWPSVCHSVDEADHEDFFERLYDLVVGCKPTGQ
jgi:hypothetical protein